LPAFAHRIKIAVLVVVCIVVAAVAYFLVFPRNTFISISRPRGEQAGTITATTDTAGADFRAAEYRK
jgi:hypothetical protein